jgi:hypothetical protein
MDSESGDGKRPVGWKAALLLVVTIGGGTNGVLSCLVYLASNQATVREAVAVVLLMSIYGCGLYSGIAWQNRGMANENLPKLFLYAQVPVLQSKLICFKLWALGSYTVVFHPKEFVFDAGYYLGNYWEFSLLQAPHEAGIGVNILPFSLIYLIWRPGTLFPLTKSGD